MKIIEVVETFENMTWKPTLKLPLLDSHKVTNQDVQPYGRTT